MDARLKLYATGKAFLQKKPHTTLPASLENFEKIKKTATQLDRRGLLSLIIFQKDDTYAPVYDGEDVVYQMSR